MINEKSLSGFVNKWQFIERTWNDGETLSYYNREFFKNVFNQIRKVQKDDSFFKNHSLSPKEQELLINKIGLPKSKPTA